MVHHTEKESPSPPSAKAAPFRTLQLRRYIRPTAESSPGFEYTVYPQSVHLMNALQAGIRGCRIRWSKWLRGPLRANVLETSP
jgi:hypothetical protein